MIGSRATNLQVQKPTIGKVSCAQCTRGEVVIKCIILPTNSFLEHISAVNFFFSETTAADVATKFIFESVGGITIAKHELKTAAPINTYLSILDTYVQHNMILDKGELFCILYKINITYRNENEVIYLFETNPGVAPKDFKNIFNFDK